jgi:hypothetical protein
MGVPEDREPPQPAAGDGADDAVDDAAEDLAGERESAYELLQRGEDLIRRRHHAQAAVVLERAALEPGALDPRGARAPYTGQPARAGARGVQRSSSRSFVALRPVRAGAVAQTAGRLDEARRTCAWR